MSDISSNQGKSLKTILSEVFSFSNCCMYLASLVFLYSAFELRSAKEFHDEPMSYLGLMYTNFCLNHHASASSNLSFAPTVTDPGYQYDSSLCFQVGNFVKDKVIIVKNNASG